MACYAKSAKGIVPFAEKPCSNWTAFDEEIRQAKESLADLHADEYERGWLIASYPELAQAKQVFEARCKETKLLIADLESKRSAYLQAA